MPESPFRFVVLDDPVQAMDPTKVDGLVQVLVEIAQTRQVVVFSHDDRFAAAVRRSPHTVPVAVLEVVRQAGSQVATRVTYSPADRFVKDGFGLAMDDGLPAETRDRVLPGLLRMALEAQARDTYFARRLTSGAHLGQVEHDWGEARKTRDRLALALDDPTKIEAWLDKAPHRRRALRTANRMHDQLTAGDPKGACRDVEATVRDLRDGVR